MSRRERISDFTRPVLRHQVSDSRHVISKDTQQRLETAVPKRVETMPPRYVDVKRTATKTRPAYPRQDKSHVLRRQGLNKLPPFTPRKTSRFNYRFVGTTLAISIAIAALPYGVYWQIQRYGSVKGAKDTHVVSDEQPRYFTSSSIMDVAAKVKPIDSIDDNAKVLEDVSNLGWYATSSKPGQPGAMVIAGYISGDQKFGAFAGIESIKKNDYIQIETGDGRILTYKVHDIKKYKPEDLDRDELMKPAVSDKEGLNLLTFTDKAKKDTDLGQSRYVVFAIKE